MVIGFLMILHLMFSIFSSFWTSASTASDASTSTPLHVPTLQGTSIVGPSVFDQVDGGFMEKIRENPLVFRWILIIF